MGTSKETPCGAADALGAATPPLVVRGALMSRPVVTPPRPVAPRGVPTGLAGTRRSPASETIYLLAIHPFDRSEGVDDASRIAPLYSAALSYIPTPESAAEKTEDWTPTPGLPRKEKAKRSRRPCKRGCMRENGRLLWHIAAIAHGLHAGETANVTSPCTMRHTTKSTGQVLDPRFTRPLFRALPTFLCCVDCGARLPDCSFISTPRPVAPSHRGPGRGS